MTDTTPPPPAAPPQPPSPEKNRINNGVIIGSAAAVIAAIIGTGIVVVQSTNGDSKPATTAVSSAPDEDSATSAAEEPEPTFDEIDTDSFTMKLRTTKRQCFGSAGCNVTVEPDLSYVGFSEDIDPEAVYEITYEITGDESGPVIQTAELSNKTSLNYTPTLITTASASTKVSVEITDVTTRAE